MKSSRNRTTNITPISSRSPKIRVVDIGINLTNKAFRKNWKAVIRRAIDAGVNTIILTGTSIQSSRESLELAREWFETEGTKNIFATVAVHPHDAKAWKDGGSSSNNNNNNATSDNDGADHSSSAASSLDQLRELLEDPFAIAVGECGLDYNRNFSSRCDQIRAFREQVRLAHDLGYPLFLHEREAHEDFLRVLDEVRQSFVLANSNDQDGNNTQSPRLFPEIVVHCFTGTKEEASAYIRRCYYLGFTGTICKKDRGAHLRSLLPSLPLERLMVETDAPYMGFKKKETKRRHSEPADCIDVAQQLSKSMNRPFEEVCQQTTHTALNFFRISRTDVAMPLVASRNSDCES